MLLIGGVQCFCYDVCGQLIEVEDFVGWILCFLCDMCGLFLVVSDVIGLIVCYVWDGLGNFVCESDGWEMGIDYVYDVFGCIVVMCCVGEEMCYICDGNGNLVVIICVFDGVSVVFVYDVEDCVILYCDVCGWEICWDYVGLFFLVLCQVFDGGVLCYEYDGMFNFVVLVNEKGECVMFVCDVVEWLVEEIGFDVWCQFYCYDVSGLLVEWQDGMGVICYVCDVIGQIVCIELLDGIVYEFGWNVVGWLIVVMIFDCIFVWIYDVFGNFIIEM